MKLTIQQRIDLSELIPRYGGSFEETKQGYRLKHDLKITEAYKKQVEWVEDNGVIRFNPDKDDFTLTVDEARKAYLIQIIELRYAEVKANDGKVAGVPTTLDEIVMELMEGEL
jgi:hypothetical protein